MEDTFKTPPFSPEPHSPVNEEEVSAPTSPPPPPPRQPILLYSQRYQPNPAEYPRYFYDPHTLFNEYAFTLESDQEYIILIQGMGYEHQENHVYPAFTHQPNGPLTINDEQEPQALCLLLHYIGPSVNLTVAAHTSLAFLLENARVSIRQCYLTPMMEFCLLNDEQNMVPPTQSLPPYNFLTTHGVTETSPTEATLQPTLTQQVAARNPLLLRRMRALPKLSPLAAVPTSE